ncbi:TetR/AcrR family transcriptional regulator [Micromonospora sp. C28SCA-DRY-2]|uniref:TetR/AcrR family transcriptional regulator n=1 Tax=Micromonospora sp. C28SCA-DRY-2 TaxID=3059522 RepID=UPI002675D53B|nr:TetR/AcrR family transcriptional regulator [Micromonospora sp. C28SCA-DRY-2]MDO3705676.1 TetR/AcrR family transcriptional regulator [Micromonospora sp. C28SCA-DRY-2]
MTTEYSGTGDPARSLALLWRTRERVSRKGRPDLSVDRIVRAAIEVADTEGLAALSMRRVAERLGVGTMSLYTYVPGKGELLDVMLDTVYGETARPEDVPGGWRGRLEQIARETRALYLRHPWLLQVATTRPPLGPNVIARYEYELRAVDGIGLTDLEMDAVVTLISGFVHGAVRGAVEAAQAAERTGMTEDQWWQAHAPYLEKAMDPRRFPVAARVGAAAGEEYQAAGDPARAFEFGLHRILDGIEVLIRDRPGGGAPPAAG